MLRTITLLALALLLLGLSACAAAAGPTPTPAPAGAGEDLAGTEWQLEEIITAAGPVAVRPDARPTLAFGADGQASGLATCNRFGGSYTQDGASLSFGPLASTKMACLDEALNQQERLVLGLLGQAASATIEGDSLRIATAAGEELVYTRA